MTFLLPTVADTKRLGADLARLLRPGDLLILTGPLGAGKTALTQGIGAELGVAGPITSPTFIIARVHPPDTGTIPLVHVDAYRLGSLDELDDLDLDASIEDSVTVVEWGAGVVEQLTDSHLEIRIDRHDNDAREIELIGHGGDWDTRLKALTEGTC
ncbi:tRNA (adenosine(37)-N6)-threonylcarbamoyltransferase complex ATPase subunit type 1 TsaE [Stackebrandtia soli]|uniref:tRNA (adenosine(37)-N6)-threonylcarbamoyltransferase complex ATPase subunit type 1 TsaE n=1 Tax=Stackebrandtia soli TaxID=1892856 RepID=UPI0039EBAD74